MKKDYIILASKAAEEIHGWQTPRGKVKEDESGQVKEMRFRENVDGIV